MGLLNKIFGASDRGDAAVSSADEQAIARYRYLVRTAPPEAIEQSHAEAFARLSPEQRRRVLEELSEELPLSEREGAVRSGDTPQALARTATRAELRQPGAMERAFGRVGSGGAGFGSMMAGSFLGAIAGSVLGSAIAQNFIGDSGAAGFDQAGGDFTEAADEGGGFDGDGGLDI